MISQGTKTKSSGQPLEASLVPIALTGVIVPSKRQVAGERGWDFSLACANGVKYKIEADAEWQRLLSHHCWQEVRMSALLDSSTKTLWPQKMTPRGPRSSQDGVISIAPIRKRDRLKKALKAFGDLVLVPAAVFAVMVS